MSYPKDPSYEKQVTGGYGYPPMGAPSAQYPPPTYPSAPPPYSSMPSTMPGASTMPQYPTQQYGYGTSIPLPAQPYPPVTSHMMHQAPPPYAGYQQVPYNPGYPVQPGFSYGQNITATAQFDSGARFDGIASHNIPPPPPGCAPNAAQMAVAQGGSVVASQKKAGWLTGGSGGGISFW